MDILYDKIRSFGRRGSLQRVYTAAANIVATSYRTELSIVGKGYLLYVATYQTVAAQAEQIRITVDGAPASLIGLANGTYMPSHTTSTGGMGKFFALDIPFGVSLKVETYNPTTAGVSVGTELAYIISP